MSPSESSGKLNMNLQGSGGDDGRMGDQGHLMLRDRIVPQSEVIKAIMLGASPYSQVEYEPARSGRRRRVGHLWLSRGLAARKGTRERGGEEQAEERNERRQRRRADRGADEGKGREEGERAGVAATGGGRERTSRTRRGSGGR